MNLAKECRELANSVCKKQNDEYNKEFDKVIELIKEKARDGKFKTIAYAKNDIVAVFLVQKLIDEGFTVSRNNKELELTIIW